MLIVTYAVCNPYISSNRYVVYC